MELNEKLMLLGGWLFNICLCNKNQVALISLLTVKKNKILSIPLFPNFAIIPYTCFNCFKKDLRVNTMTVKHDDRIRFLSI